ncbi:MAG: hypothetical protein FWC85_00015 [Elusimicrobia bacterium]|nr:hypothetical protein [Elusimicrobiota bacterium]
MKEQIKLLMEETGCEANEAELALTLCENDIERAVKTIGMLLKYILAFKAKLRFKESNLFALVHLAVNAKTSEILRFSCVVSYNPFMYETSIDTDWFSFEKTIYSFRLDKGAATDYTQGILPKLREFLTVKLKEVPVIGVAEIKEMLAEFFSAASLEIEITSQELTLTQFKRFADQDFEDDVQVIKDNNEAKEVNLLSEVIEDPEGTAVSKLSKGDVVVALITDERDIAHYLSHLMGGRKDGKAVPLEAHIKKVVFTEDEAVIELFYASSILGTAKAGLLSKIKVVTPQKDNNPWWKKIIPW